MEVLIALPKAQDLLHVSVAGGSSMVCIQSPWIQMTKSMAALLVCTTKNVITTLMKNEKCKELRISFARNQPELQLIVVNGQELEVVHSAKLLGVAITSGLSWNDHIDKVLKKASKCLYFLVQLKRA